MEFILTQANPPNLSTTSEASSNCELCVSILSTPSPSYLFPAIKHLGIHLGSRPPQTTQKSRLVCAQA